MEAPVKLLFVCTGNTCRSPLAAAVTRSLAGARGLPLVIDSAGIAARAGSPASAAAREVARRRGYRLDGHRARQLVAADLVAFDLVLAMTRAHVAALDALTPRGAVARVRLLAAYAPGLGVADIADPWAGDLDGYARTLGLIETACAALLDALEGAAGDALSFPAR